MFLIYSWVMFLVFSDLSLQASERPVLGCVISELSKTNLEFRNNKLPDKTIRQIEELYLTCPLPEARQKAFELVLNNDLKLLSLDQQKRVRALLSSAEYTDEKGFGGFLSRVEKNELGRAQKKINLTLPLKYRGTELELIIKYHELTHAIQEERLIEIGTSEAEMIGLNSARIVRYLEERGAIEAEYKMLQALPKNIRLRLADEIRSDKLFSESDKNLAIRVLTGDQKSVRAYTLNEYKHGRYSAKSFKDDSKKTETELKWAMRAFFTLGTATVAHIILDHVCEKKIQSKIDLSHDGVFQQLCKKMSKFRQ